jgi:hypothetical protein
MSFRQNIFPLAKCFVCGIVLTQIATPLPDFAAEPKIKPAVETAPPPLPEVKPPIEYFRALLLLSPTERERALAERSPEQKKILLAKCKEYELMTAEERDLRLAVTELRWYLVPLMRLAPAERGELLKRVPVEKLPLIEDRLRQWDALPAGQQKEFLENEMTVQYFLRLQSGSPEQKLQVLETVSPEMRAKLETELKEWQSLPTEKRERMCNRFEQFFTLGAQEKQKTLSALSSEERLEMENTLKTFQKLPPDQRRHCIDSFSKFASMNLAERNEFLRKAELWQSMSSSERKAWRELVHKLPKMPPLPPGLKIQPPFPPSPQMATNLPRSK